MGLAMGTVRYILFFFNFILALAGLAICITGVLAAWKKDSSLNIMTENDAININTTTPAIIFAVSGACIFIFAFFGCCGALRESYCMIITYAMMLIALFILQVVVAVLVYKFRSETQGSFKDAVTNAYLDYKTKIGTREVIDELQSAFECCGSTDNKTPWATLNMSPPPSCYKDKNTSNPIFDKGCVSTLTDAIETLLSSMGLFAIIMAVIQLVAIVFSLCLASSVRHSRPRGYA